MQAYGGEVVELRAFLTTVKLQAPTALTPGKEQPVPLP
jgi:hypothetical protein